MHLRTSLELSLLSRRWQRRKHCGESGFSLAEVSMAIAIIAFAFVVLLALWPKGLDTYRQAIDTTTTAQIAQRVVAELQESDFDLLVDTTKNKAIKKAGEFFVLPLRYFDDQGNELDPVLNPGSKTQVLYTVYVRGSAPGDIDPTKHKSDRFTALPATSSRFNPRDMTILTVQVVSNIEDRQVVPLDTTTLLVNPVKAKELHLPFLNYSAIVARNGRNQQSL